VNREVQANRDVEGVADEASLVSHLGDVLDVTSPPDVSLGADVQLEQDQLV
jgi:hypothetical protein